MKIKFICVARFWKVPSLMRNSQPRILFATVLATTLTLIGCGDNERKRQLQAVPSTAKPAISALELQALKQENESLKAEVSKLKLQVEDLGQTPQVLLERVQAAVKVEEIIEAQNLAKKLEQRYGPGLQTNSANQLVAKLKILLSKREEEARLIEAKGLFAVKPSTAAEVKGFVIKVESISLGNRWSFNSYDSSYSYRDVVRGEKFVLLKTTLNNKDKSRDPNLPDIAIYSIDGKEMRLIDTMRYEFRRWSSYGTYIGLYHDYKNDFAHAAAIPFNAAASIDEEIAKSPFAVVASPKLCHSRETKIGQPEVIYRRIPTCNTKNVLEAEDFINGDYRILAFFNKPKGL